jgi:hypothetical protein
LSIKDEDPLLVRGPDVRTLLELQKLNDMKKMRGYQGQLTGNRSKIFEEILGGREHLTEVGVEMMYA